MEQSSNDNNKKRDRDDTPVPATSQPPPAKRPKGAEYAAPVLNAWIENTESIENLAVRRDKHISDLNKQHGCHITTRLVECVKKGNGWRLVPETFTIVQGFAGLVFDNGGTPDLEMRNVKPTVAKLPKLVSTMAAHIVPFVWLDDTTDPMTFWQVIYTTDNMEAIHAVADFYQVFFEKTFVVEGLTYLAPQWISNNLNDKIAVWKKRLNYD